LTAGRSAASADFTGTPKADQPAIAVKRRRESLLNSIKSLVVEWEAPVVGRGAKFAITNRCGARITRYAHLVTTWVVGP